MLQNGCFLAVPELANPGKMPTTIRTAPAVYDLDEFVSMTYYINLDNDVERRGRMERQFAQLGIRNYRRMPGVLSAPGDLPNSPNLCLDAPIDLEALGPSEKQAYLLRTWGCRSAHLACLQDAIAHNYKSIAVFEDNCVLSPQTFKSQFAAFAKDLDSLPDDFHIAYLDLGPTPGSSSPSPSPADNKEGETKAEAEGKTSLRRVTKNALGSHAYILHNHQGWVFPHVVKNLIWSNRPVHSCLNNLLCSLHLTQAFQAEPPLVTALARPAERHGARGAD
jgi:GR25 family glycosyltransferase involved in LPS biosynthesis